MANITFPFPFPVILPVLPEIIVAVMAMVILIWDLFLPAERKQWTAYAAIATCLVAIDATLRTTGRNRSQQGCRSPGSGPGPAAHRNALR